MQNTHHISTKRTVTQAVCTAHNDVISETTNCQKYVAIVIFFPRIFISFSRCENLITTTPRTSTSTTTTTTTSVALGDPFPGPKTELATFNRQDFKALHGLAPAYLADLCQPVASVGSRRRLRSVTRGDLVTRPTSTYFGARSFAAAGPTAWNQLPADVRSTESVNSFKTVLKTFRFRLRAD